MSCTPKTSPTDDLGSGREGTTCRGGYLFQGGLHGALPGGFCLVALTVPEPSVLVTGPKAQRGTNLSSSAPQPGSPSGLSPPHTPQLDPTHGRVGWRGNLTGVSLGPRGQVSSQTCRGQVCGTHGRMVLITCTSPSQDQLAHMGAWPQTQLRLGFRVPGAPQAGWQHIPLRLALPKAGVQIRDPSL